MENVFAQIQEVCHDQKWSICEGLLTFKSCLEALRDMVAEKSPGTDDLPHEFYKGFTTIVSVVSKKDSDPI